MLTLCGTTPIAVTHISNIKRQKVRLKALKKEAEEERERARETARERVSREFEKGQLGLAATSAVFTSFSNAECSEGMLCLRIVRMSIPTLSSARHDMLNIVT